jgi:3-methylcrotonyl-CoA carboxylase beta subunit
MGADQAAGVLTQVKRDSAAGRGETVDEAALSAYHEKIKGTYQEQTTALFATARLWDDGIITPNETRSALSLALSLADLDTPQEHRVFGTFRM